jgi:hypothetical protein
MGDVRPKRIYSTLDGEPELEQSIEDFVVTLAERVDQLQDAQLVGDLTSLHKQSSDLHDEAAQLGYPVLAEAATALSEACTGADREGALERLVALTEIARSVRRGHRGAF